MSAAPIITASLRQGFTDGINLYQGIVQTVDLNALLDVFYLGEKLPPYASGDDSGTKTTYSNRIRITAASLPGGLTTPSNYAAPFSSLEGTPTTVALTSVLFKIEVFTYTDFTPTGTDIESHVRVGYVSIPINVVAAPTSVTPATPVPVILPTVINAVKGTYFSFALTAAVSTYPVFWDATGLPPGLNIEGSNIEGTPTETGTTAATLSLRYKLETDSGYIIETKSISVVVTAAAAVDTGTGTVYIAAGGIDLFLDLQSMGLSLDIPKAETVIAADAQVINQTSGKTFVVKPDQILDLNVRFTKGATVVDPDPASMRFGIGSKIGGPLLMVGSTFTKVGTGSSAYFKMRITSESSEFEALEKDYYDDDAVEAVAQTADTQAGGTDPLDGLCELEFSTGSGGTLATFRSDNLAVLIRRSLLAGI